jgi:biopolymer transport protein ExbB
MLLMKLIEGGIMMIPLLICSILTLAVLIERIHAFYRNSKVDVPALRAQIMEFLRKNRLDDTLTLCASTPGPVAAVLLVGLQTFQKVKDIKGSPEMFRSLMTKAMDDYAVHAIHSVEKRLNWLATVANVAPLFGMTGTVTGMIRSFGSLAGAGSLDAGVVGAGISEALVATASGLIIALAALIPYNAFLNQVEKINLQIGEASSELVDLVSLQAEKGFNA